MEGNCCFGVYVFSLDLQISLPLCKRTRRTDYNGVLLYLVNKQMLNSLANSFKYLCWQPGHSPSRHTLCVQASCRRWGWTAMHRCMTYNGDKGEKENRTVKVIMSAVKKKVLLACFTVNFLVSECVSPQWSEAPALEGHMLKIEGWHVTYLK